MNVVLTFSMLKKEKQKVSKENVKANRKSYASQINCARKNMNVHKVVNNSALNVAFMAVNKNFSTCAREEYCLLRGSVGLSYANITESYQC